MKFEKLNENKIRIILSNQDLADKNIDFNSFMSNSAETQTLFLDMLEEAEEKVGFITRDHKIKIEALAMADGDFVVTVTRFGKKDENDVVIPNKNKKIKVRRKTNTLNSENLVYEFKDFDDFCLFSSYVSKIKSAAGSAAAALAFRLVVHRHVHMEVPDIVGEDELGLRQGLFLVHLDFQRGGGCHSAKAHGHGAVRLDRLHRRLFHSTDQLIDVKRQMYHLAF